MQWRQACTDARQQRELGAEVAQQRHEPAVVHGDEQDDGQRVEQRQRRRRHLRRGARARRSLAAPPLPALHVAAQRTCQVTWAAKRLCPRPRATRAQAHTAHMLRYWRSSIALPAACLCRHRQAHDSQRMIHAPDVLAVVPTWGLQPPSTSIGSLAAMICAARDGAL